MTQAHGKLLAGYNSMVPDDGQNNLILPLPIYCEIRHA
jgi:hypothetical protein